MGRLEGKVAIITGAGKGIGRAAALAFAQEGAKVVIATRSAQPGDETLDMVRQAGGDALMVQTDICNEASLAGMVAKTLEHYGRIDVLVNNAAISEQVPPVERIEEVGVELFDRIMEVDVRGVFLTCRAVIPHMRENGGAVVNVSSVAGIRGNVSGLSYTTAKHAIVGFTKQLAVIEGPNGIRVNCVSPGGVDTPMIAYKLKDPDSSNWERIRATPAGRLAAPSELAAVMVFLASDEASFVYGENIVADGGVSL